MSNKAVFPIRLRCDEMGGGSYSFQSLFLASKPKNFSWYGYDTVIHTPTIVEFVIFDMADNVTGGLGKETVAFKAKAREDLTKPAIDQKLFSMAKERREKELRDAEHIIITRYAEEIRSSMLQQSPQGTA